MQKNTGLFVKHSDSSATMSGASFVGPGPDSIVFRNLVINDFSTSDVTTHFQRPSNESEGVSYRYASQSFVSSKDGSIDQFELGNDSTNHRALAAEATLMRLLISVY